VADEMDARRRSARRTLILLALVCAAPVVASYVAYYWLHPDTRTNYGALLPAKPAPDILGLSRDGTPWRLESLHGRWVLLVVGKGECDASCASALYATRQARTIQGREQDRIARVLLQPDGSAAPASALLDQHPGLAVVQGDPRQWASLPGAQSIFVVDPLGNLVLGYTSDPDIKRLAKDLERLLKASRIG
jgi:hypothetical protein